MFDTIGITASTANWLLAQAVRREAIGSALQQIASEGGLTNGVVSLGPLRIGGSRRANVVVVWNNDLLTGEGYERWGFLRLTGEFGLFGEAGIQEEVFERFLTITDLRLRGLKLDDRLIHRALGDDLHTCLAGRGGTARQFSLAFSDKAIELSGSKVPTVIALGPFNGQLGNAPSSMPLERKKGAVLVEEATRIVATLYKRPALESTLLLELRSVFQPAAQLVIDYGPGLLQVPALRETGRAGESLTYEGWVTEGSPLSREQRAILEADVYLKSPLRIIGPGGSGKTLLMQLITMRLLRKYRESNQSCKILYIVHNSAMMQTVKERFAELGCTDFVVAEKTDQKLEVLTLGAYSTNVLQPDIVPVIDQDAQETKQFQRVLVSDSLKSAIDGGTITAKKHPLLHQVSLSGEGFNVFAELLVAEFGVAIKGHDLASNKQAYVFSERSLSRLHAALNADERSIVFDIFTSYQKSLTQDYSVLDADDLAITVLGKVTTPLWRLKRRQEGYDFIFVDETQLFNENERRLFPLLTKGDTGHVPIVLALDEAQAINATVSAGFGTLGFGDLSNESLNMVFRSTSAILRLAFHIIQKSTDLFGPDFPDFTKSSISLIPDNHHSARVPVLLTGGQARNPGNFVAKVILALRKDNLRQIAVVVFAERYWPEVVAVLRGEKLPVVELTKRGEKVDIKGPLVVVSKPEFIGGQEFDAVVCVGLEEGIVPANAGSNQALAASFTQRTLREIYVTITRARYRLVVANSTSSNVSPVLKDSLGICLFEEKASDWLNS